MINLIKKTMPFIIILGTFITALTIFGYANGYTVVHNKITYIGTYAWNHYEIDLLQYLKSLEYSLNITNLEVNIGSTPTLPTLPQWDTTDVLQTLRSILESLKYTVKMLSYIINWLVYTLNLVLLAPLKLILYPTRIIMTLMGLDQTNLEFIVVIRTISNANIPYIPIEW